MTAWGRQAVIWALGLVVTFVMLGLGIWQADRFENSGQQAMVERMVEEPRPLGEFRNSENGLPSGFGHQVVVSGEFLPQEQVVAGVEAPHRVVAAFELEDGNVLPVVRGKTSADSVSEPPTGQVELHGMLLDTDPEQPRPEPTEGVIPGIGYVGPDSPSPAPTPADASANGDQRGAGEVSTADLPSLDNVRVPALAQIWPQQMTGGYLSLGAEQSRAGGLEPVVVPIPDNAEGQARNRGYSLQWWLFAAVAMIATIKLSHDAARNTGFMRREDSGEDTHDNSTQ